MTFRALRPLGLLKEEAADQAIATGHAWRLGGSGACTGLELFCRDARGISASTTSIPAFLARLAGEDEAERAAWLPRLHALSRGSVWPDGLPAPPLIMGIVNVTPDSFHDGGRFMGTERAIEHGRRLAAEGAAIVDVGGESTRPGAAPVPVDEEIRRVLPVVRALAADAIRVSIDTRNAAVMRAALDAGASFINDVTALRHDREAAPLAAECGVPVILMHMRGDPATMQQAPHYVRACFEVLEFLERRAEDLEAAGLRRDRLILDPASASARPSSTTSTSSATSTCTAASAVRSRSAPRARASSPGCPPASRPTSGSPVHWRFMSSRSIRARRSSACTMLRRPARRSRSRVR
ncbi:MAG TPA: dihydropteroate synthase [Geminicoccaceae bacterium]